MHSEEGPSLQKAAAVTLQLGHFLCIADYEVARNLNSDFRSLTCHSSKETSLFNVKIIKQDNSLK